MAMNDFPTYNDGLCDGWHGAIEAAAALCWNAESETEGDRSGDVDSQRWKALQGAAEAIEHLKCPYCVEKEGAT